MSLIPSIDEIEDFMYSTYLQDYKSKMVILDKSKIELLDIPVNEKKSINIIKIDKLKLVYLSNILPLGLNKVEVKKSKLHGYGVFAKRNILKDELITFYPADIIEYLPNGDRNIKGHLTNIFRSIRFEKQFGKTCDKKFRNYDYAFDINENYTIIGSPYFKEDTNYMGHFINDGAKSNSTHKSNEIYKTITSLKANCRYYNLKDLHVAVISTKNIKKGEELFIIYGIRYWESYNKK